MDCFVSEKFFPKLFFPKGSILEISNQAELELTVIILMNVSLSAESSVKLNWEQAVRSGRVPLIEEVDMLRPPG